MVAESPPFSGPSSAAPAASAPDTDARQRVLLVTGVLGAGKTTALHALEARNRPGSPNTATAGQTCRPRWPSVSIRAPAASTLT